MCSAPAPVLPLSSVSSHHAAPLPPRAAAARFGWMHGVAGGPIQFLDKGGDVEVSFTYVSQRVRAAVPRASGCTAAAGKLSRAAAAPAGRAKGMMGL